MRRLALTEYLKTEAVPLSPAECDLLRRLAPWMTVTPTIGQRDCYDPTPDSHVGALSIGDLAITIRPKVPIDRLLFLLSYVVDSGRWSETPFGFDQEGGLLEAIIPSFLARLRHALGRGVLQGYRVEEMALTTVRGRLRLDDQLREHYGRTPPWSAATTSSPRTSTRTVC